MIKDIRKQVTKPGRNMGDDELAQHGCELEICSTGLEAKSSDEQRVTTVTTAKCTDRSLQHVLVFHPERASL